MSLVSFKANDAVNIEIYDGSIFLRILRLISFNVNGSDHTVLFCDICPMHIDE